MSSAVSGGFVIRVRVSRSKASRSFRCSIVASDQNVKPVDEDVRVEPLVERGLDEWEIERLGLILEDPQQDIDPSVRGARSGDPWSRHPPSPGSIDAGPRPTPARDRKAIETESKT